MADQTLSYRLAGTPKQLNHLPVVAHALRNLGLAKMIDERVPPHEDRELSVGRCVEALILCILLGSHTLSRVAETLESYDLQFLFGEDFEAHKLHDDRLGRALDSLFKCGLGELNTASILEAIRAYKLRTSVLHFDTTSVSVYGDYSMSCSTDPEDPNSSPHMTYGFSKDHRPDLKQLLYGLTVTDDGFVPLLGRFTDGNRSDSKENHFNLTRVAQTMPNPSKVLVVADSKLFSGANLQNAMDHGLNVLTLLPKTVGIWDTTFGLLKKQLISAPILREVVDIIEDEDEAVETVTDNWRGLSTEVRYQWTDEEKERHEIDLRALVVYSTSLERVKIKSRKKLYDREKKSLAILDKRFVKKRFHCQSDAQAAAEEALKNGKQLFISSIKIVKREELKKRKQRGRPKKDALTPEKEVFYQIVLIHKENKTEWKNWLLRECSFILVTFPNPAATDSEILNGYKNQTGVEGAMRWTKGPAEVAPIFLHTPSRIGALGLIYVWALMVYKLIQREIRTKLSESATTIPGNRGRTEKPTSEVLFRLLENTMSVPVIAEDGKTYKLLMNVTTEKACALRLLGINLLESPEVIVEIIEPKRGQRGYKPKPEDYLIKPKKKRPRKKTVRRRRE